MLPLGGSPFTQFAILMCFAIAFLEFGSPGPSGPPPDGGGRGGGSGS